MNHNKNAGMTLLELLIVMAITGILSTTLIPNVMNARNRSIDVAAQSYLREAMTMQEIHWFDNGVYTLALSDLRSAGLKQAPSDITFTIVDATVVGYCMTATRANGSGKVFHSTLHTGVTDSFQETVCTTAN